MNFDRKVWELVEAVAYGRTEARDIVLRDLGETIFYSITHRCYVRIYDYVWDDRNQTNYFHVEIVWPRNHRMYPGKLRLSYHQLKVPSPLMALTVGASIDAE